MSNTTPLAFDALAALVSSPQCPAATVAKAVAEMTSCDLLAEFEADFDHATKSKRWRAKAWRMRSALTQGGHLPPSAGLCMFCRNLRVLEMGACSACAAAIRARKETGP